MSRISSILVYLLIPRISTQIILPFFTLNCELVTGEYNILQCFSNGTGKNHVFPFPNAPYADPVHGMEIVINDTDGTVYINNDDTFTKYSTVLENLYIELGSKNIHRPFPANWNELERKKTLFNFGSLRELTFKNLNFHSTFDQWILPADLRYFTSQGTRYNEYNLTYLRNLRSVDFTDNHFTKLPAFHYPLHSLKKLYLNGNPLNEVTTNDIAKLCMLENLRLDGTSFEKPERFCECERLQMFIGNLTEEWTGTEFFTSFELDEPLTCYNKLDIKCTADELDLKEAISHREHCLTGNLGKTIPTPVYPTPTTTPPPPPITTTPPLTVDQPESNLSESASSLNMIIIVTVMALIVGALIAVVGLVAYKISSDRNKAGPERNETLE